jgi:hypothetical protein
VPAAPDGDQQLVVAGEADGLQDVGHARGAGDEGGPAVHVAVPDAACLLVVRVARQDERTAKPLSELVDDVSAEGDRVPRQSRNLQFRHV